MEHHHDPRTEAVGARRCRLGHMLRRFQPLFCGRRHAQPFLCVGERAGGRARGYRGRHAAQKASPSTPRRALAADSSYQLPLLQEMRCTWLAPAAKKEIDLLFGDKMRRAAQLPTLSWHGRSSAVGLPPCSLPPQDLGRVLDGGPIRHGVDSQQLVVPGSPPTACTGIQQGCQLVCPAAGTFWWCWLSPFVLHPAPPMSPHDLLLLKRLKNIP